MSQQLKRVTRIAKGDTPTSSETETEPEPEMNDAQYKESLAFKFGKVKKIDTTLKKGKVAEEIRKRVVVGFMVFTFYFCPLFINPMAQVFVQLYFCMRICYEPFDLKQKEFETTLRYRMMKHTLIFLAFFAFSPNAGPMERSIVEASGMSAKTHPIIFAIFYDYHLIICMVLSLILFILSLFSWRERNLRFQLTKGTGLILHVFYFSLVGSSATYSYIKAGRWWLYFAVISVVLNDVCAYFAGRAFGKHHLIGLSPNKTIEGFVGGTIANIISCYLLSTKLLNSNFSQCPPGRLDIALFEDWQCEEGVQPFYSPIYIEQEYELPFEMFGLKSFWVKPAVLYTMLYALFASLVAPTFGFFASGFKRAIGIKDFAASLPGHGGWTDRMDCLSIVGHFNYFFITQVIMKAEIQSEEAYAAVIQLQDFEKITVMNSIAERFGLSTQI